MPIDIKEILDYDPKLNLTPEQIATLEQRQLNEVNHQIAAEITLMRQEVDRKADPNINIKNNLKSEIYFNPTFETNPNYQPYEEISTRDPKTGGRKF